MSELRRDLASVVSELECDDPTDAQTLRESTESFEKIAHELNEALRKAQG